MVRDSKISSALVFYILLPLQHPENGDSTKKTQRSTPKNGGQKRKPKTKDLKAKSQRRIPKGEEPKENT